jgi:hypothetical protein
MSLLVPSAGKVPNGKCFSQIHSLSQNTEAPLSTKQNAHHLEASMPEMAELIVHTLLLVIGLTMLACDVLFTFISALSVRMNDLAPNMMEEWSDQKSIFISTLGVRMNDLAPNLEWSDQNSTFISTLGVRMNDLAPNMEWGDQNSTFISTLGVRMNDLALNVEWSDQNSTFISTLGVKMNDLAPNMIEKWSDQNSTFISTLGVRMNDLAQLIFTPSVRMKQHNQPIKCSLRIKFQRHSPMIFRHCVVIFTKPKMHHCQLFF